MVWQHSLIPSPGVHSVKPNTDYNGTFLEPATEIAAGTTQPVDGPGVADVSSLSAACEHARLSMVSKDREEHTGSHHYTAHHHLRQRGSHHPRPSNHETRTCSSLISYLPMLQKHMEDTKKSSQALRRFPWLGDEFEDYLREVDGLKMDDVNKN